MQLSEIYVLEDHDNAGSTFEVTGLPAIPSAQDTAFFLKFTILGYSFQGQGKVSFFRKAD